jgi:hypothetical protein
MTITKALISLSTHDLCVKSPTESLQNFSRSTNKRALHKKAAKSRGRKKLTTKGVRQEVIGEIDEYE